MDASDTPLIILLVALLVCSALTSASETALFGITHGQRAMLKRTNAKLSRMVESLLSRPRELLMQVLLLNMAVNASYFIVTSVLTIRAESMTVQVAISVGSLGAIILVGEVFAKLFASSATILFLRFASPMHMMFRRPISPVIRFMYAWIVGPLSRLLAPSHFKMQPLTVSPEQMGTLIELSVHDGVIDLGEQELLTSIVSMGQMRVEQMMTPRVDMSWIDFNTSTDEIITICKATGRTRLLVCKNGIDSGISGMINARKVLEGQSIEEALSEVLFVPEQSRLDMLIEQFRKTGQSIAVCVDEHGGVSGIVTIADVTKELIEEVTDPHHDLTNEVQLVGVGRWIVPGRLSIRDWSTMFADQSVIEHAKKVNTLGGLVMVLLDRLPAVGDQVRIGEIQLTVVEMDERSIHRIEVEILADDGKGDESHGGAQ